MNKAEMHYLSCLSDNCEIFACVARRDYEGQIAILEGAIKKHRSKTGHDMCWENDEDLWSVLREEKKPDLNHRRPPREEFLKKCQQYCDGRKK